MRSYSEALTQCIAANVTKTNQQSNCASSSERIAVAEKLSEQTASRLTTSTLRVQRFAVATRSNQEATSLVYYLNAAVPTVAAAVERLLPISAQTFKGMLMYNAAQCEHDSGKAKSC